MHPGCQITQVYLCRAPIDFRKAINGLSVMVEQELGLDPFNGTLTVFINRHRTKIKVLYWHRNGFCLWHKRLEQDLFCWPLRGDANTMLSSEQFDWLLRGLDISKLQPHPARLFSVSS